MHLRIQITHRVNPYAFQFPSYHTSLSSNFAYPIPCRDVIYIQITLYKLLAFIRYLPHDFSIKSSIVYAGNLSV